MLRANFKLEYNEPLWESTKIPEASIVLQPLGL